MSTRFDELLTCSKAPAPCWAPGRSPSNARSSNTSAGVTTSRMPRAGSLRSRLRTGRSKPRSRRKSRSLAGRNPATSSFCMMSAHEHFADGSDRQLADATRVESPIDVLRSTRVAAVADLSRVRNFANSSWHFRCSYAESRADLLLDKGNPSQGEDSQPRSGDRGLTAGPLERVANTPGSMWSPQRRLHVIYLHPGRHRLRGARSAPERHSSDEDRAGLGRDPRRDLGRADDEYRRQPAERPLFIPRVLRIGSVSLPRRFVLFGRVADGESNGEREREPSAHRAGDRQ